MQPDDQRQEPVQPAKAAFWYGLVIPLGVVVVALKLWRVVDRGEAAAWWAAPDLLRPDVLMVAGFAAVGWVVVKLAARRRFEHVALGMMQAVAVVWAALEVLANHFYQVTGSTFDLHLLVFSVGRLDETWDVIISEATAASLGLMGFVVAVLVTLPWGLWLWARQQQDDDDEPVGPRKLPSRFVGGWLAGAVACVGLAFVPPVGEDYTAFGRATVVNMLLSVQDVRITDEIREKADRQPLTDLEPELSDDAEQHPQNVVILVLESTRAQSMTVYDPEMETTPFLADLAEKSTVADRAYSTVPHTSKALVAMLCGVEPQLRMPITEAQPGGLPARCIADLLGRLGYQSVFLQSATERFEDRPGLTDNMGYDDFIPLERMDSSDYERSNYFGYEDAIMLPYARQWHEQRDDGPFLSTYLTLTPHHDYLAPKRRYGRHQFVDGVDEDDKLNRYKNTLYYVDQFTEELIEQYRKLGHYDDTLFVIMGDHGEAFGEHGRTQHDNVIWEEGLHVPLLIYDPSNPEGERIDYPVSQIDLVPTILDRLGIDVQGEEFPGKPIEETHEDRVVYGHCWYERRCMARIGHRLKYIDHFGQRAPEVYDLHEDPWEENNLADEKQDEIRQWRADLYGWREGVNAMYRDAQQDHTEDAILDEAPEDITDQQFVLGDFARHLGYEIDVDELRRGRRVSVTHYFEVVDDIPEGWSLFVHGESGGQMMNLDHVPVDGMLPLDQWEPGTVVANEHSFRVPQDWSAGEFTLYLGIYHRDRGRVPVEGPSDGDRRAVVFEKPLR